MIASATTNAAIARTVMRLATARMARMMTAAIAYSTLHHDAAKSATAAQAGRSKMHSVSAAIISAIPIVAA